MKLLDFIFAARPMLHLPIWSIYLVSLHYHLQLSGESFQWSNLGMMAILTAIAAAAYYCNQVYDEASDFFNRKLGFLQRNLLTGPALRRGYIVLSALAVAASFLYSWQMAFVIAQMAALGYIYSAPPLRLKDRPFWGLFANAYGIGWLVVFTVMPEINVHNAGLLGWDNPFFFLAAVGAIYVLTTIPDVDGDRITGKRTVAVVFGKRGALLLAFVLLALAAFAAYRSNHPLLMYLAIISIITTFGGLVMPNPRAILLAAKTPILLLTLMAGFFFPIYFVFIIALLFATRIYYQYRFKVIYPSLA